MNISFLIAIVINRTVLSIIGFGFAYLGFRLLTLKIEQQQTKAQETSHGFMIDLRQFDSGYFFAFFGSVIVAICLLEGFWGNMEKAFITTTDGSVNSASNISQEGTTSAIQGIGILVATIVLAILTGWYAWSNHRNVKLVQKQLQIQTDPCIIAYTRSKSDKLLEIVIKNIGRGIAEDISFERSEKDCDDQWSKLFVGSTSTPLDNTILKEGIPRLRPGGKVIIEWDANHATGLSSQLINGLYIVCKFKRSGKGSERELAPVDCFLETGSHINQKWE